MKWKKYIENQALIGRIPPEWKAKILLTAEQAVAEYRTNLLNNLHSVIKNMKPLKEESTEEYLNKLKLIEQITNLMINEKI